MLPKLRAKISLKAVNNLLLLGIIIVNLYTISAPFMPSLTFWWQTHTSKRSQELSQTLTTPSKPNTAPTAHTLIIPSMLLNTPIHEGPTSSMYQTLDKGVWRWPTGSAPDKGGNTILIGHRFTYTNPSGIFYHLDKVHLHDSIGIVWEGKQYVYKVSAIEVVPSTKVEILNQTPDDQLTLYTCTPTWNPTQRLVVIAKLESVRSPKTT